MDLLTQGILGAAVGEAVLGRKVGNKAPLWGAVGGIVPDLDTLANPFLSDVHELIFHRGITHSIFFAVVAAPLLGALVHRINRDGPATWRQWTVLMFWALFTHPLLDCFTTYGTQLFLPFSAYPVALNTIFVVDPLFSLPFLACLLVALRRPPGTRGRRLLTYLGMGWGLLYLFLCGINKTIATAAFEDALAEQGHAFVRLATRPAPLTNLLWIATADAGETILIGQYSILDGEGPARFLPIEKNAALLGGLDHPDVQRLRWFSRGYFHTQRDGTDLTFGDLRFGRDDAWLSDDGAYVFHFRIRRDPADTTRVLDVTQVPPAFRIDGATWRRYLARIGGH